MIKKYIEKPKTIEAIQRTGKNDDEIREFVEFKKVSIGLFADVGDWVIKGIDGEIYAMKPEVFKRSFEEIFEDSFET